MKRQGAVFLLGMWIGGSICMSVVATQNFFTVDRLLASSASATFRAGVGKLGQPAARELLRYLSSELNRLFFQWWNFAQLAIGVLVVWIVMTTPAPRLARALVAAMLGVVLVMTLWLQPAITSLGRSLDFVPRDPPPPGMSRFWLLHGAYTSLEMAKLAAGLVVAWLVARGSGPGERGSGVGGRAPQG